MDCPSCKTKSKEYGPDRIECPVCGKLERNDGEWQSVSDFSEGPAENDVEHDGKDASVVSSSPIGSDTQARGNVPEPNGSSQGSEPSTARRSGVVDEGERLGGRVSGSDVDPDSEVDDSGLFSRVTVSFEPGGEDEK